MSALVNLFYIYDPWLFHFFRMAFFVGIVTGCWLLYKKLKGDFRQGFIVPVDSLGVVLGLIVISIIPALIYKTADFSVALMYIKGLILFGLGVAIYNAFYINQSSEKLISDFKIGISVQAIIGFLALLGIPFMIDFALSTNIVLPRFYGSEQEYRLYNLTSSAFFQLSIFYLMLLHFLLAYNAKHNTMNSVFLFLLLFIGLISGRTFLALSVVSILVYFKWRYIPSLLVFGGVCLFLAFNYPEHKYVAHALEPLINIIHGTGRISSSTETLVQQHLFVPELKQILFGDGYYYAPEGGYYGRTDSGFIRQVLYGGIGYLIVCFAFTAYFVFRIAQNWFEGSWKFILSTLFILSVLNVKADTYAFPGIMMVLLMFLSLFGNAGKQLILFKGKE
ncbi:hypothetical protein [Otariodibacter oris]|uniref:O-antigen ligase-like membrane protein n=1 Tax=Otariodibacter oris TaxID=1032623 RepID=A0A420XHY5_9PAST|nr:hypothetical protein [Otariodibacter oris]QGM81062.1 hypothetical protein A6A10_06415 [Otariodibacter oris]RKR76751.1 hypothetical protein DES31_0057 [Otariodibacter oris]